MTQNVRKLVVGLGNYSYLSTRHSIGMVVLNDLANFLGVPWLNDRTCFGLIAKFQTDNHDIILLKPKVPMNVNGKSIVRTAKKFDIEQSNIYLVHDHLDFQIGKIQWKLTGSAGGHNGVKSAVSCLKTDKIKRFRIGIDRPTNRNDVVNYVLSDFTPQQLVTIEETRKQCLRLIIEELQLTTVRAAEISSKNSRTGTDGG